MAGEKEIRTKIKSVTSTRKITKAMEMVAASKMRKAQDRMIAARPYADKIRNVIGHLAMANSEYPHPYLSEREEIKRVGMIIISSDRGLCGGLNINVFKAAVGEIREYREKGIGVEFCVIGTKAMTFFKRFGGSLMAQASHLGDKPEISAIIAPVKVMLDAYDEGKIDRLILLSNEFINTMTQSPRTVNLIPLEPVDEDQLRHHWDYIYEPDSKEVLDGVLMRYIEAVVYRRVVENIACEMAARMVAMKSASDNALDLIDELQLVYNKARQTSITQELSEIVAGAAAV